MRPRCSFNANIQARTLRIALGVGLVDSSLAMHSLSALSGPEAGLLSCLGICEDHHGTSWGSGGGIPWGCGGGEPVKHWWEAIFIGWPSARSPAEGAEFTRA